jgi:hypothetical protein
MYYLIQENLFREIHYDKLIDTMSRYDLKHQVVKIVPFTRDILFEPIDTKNVFCFGSVKMAHIAKDYCWNPGSMFNDNHDYRVYSQYYKENLLNYDSLVCKFSDNFVPPGHLFFARPCEDTKTFTGQVFVKDSWNEFVHEQLTNGHTTTLNKDTAIQICSLKEIQREIRCWIVKGEVVTASQYRIGNTTTYKECTEPYILDYVKEMVDIYQPAEAFVLDVALTDNGLKIIEVNCINCAGFYDCNLYKLVEKIDTAFSL